MFLLLNTRLGVHDKLVDDINCGHIVDCAPTLSKDLLIELVWRLSLQKYLSETIVYCPLSLTEELLDTAIAKINSIQPFKVLPLVEQLCRAMYCKFIHLDPYQDAEKKCAKSKLFTYFKKILRIFVKSDFKELRQAKLEELFKFAGLTMRYIMSLVVNCLKLYLNPLDQKTVKPDVYELSLPELVDVEESEAVTLDNFVNELLFVCKANCRAITVDMWMFWTECSTEEEGHIRTLQNIVGEAMYLCVEELKNIEDRETKFPLVPELMSMLSAMAIKPKGEDDEIREADMESIIKHVSRKSKSQKKWFKALLRLNEDISNDRYFDCLRNNLHLAEYEDVKLILENVIQALDSSLPSECQEKLKLVALDSIKHLPLEHQVDIVKWYLQTFGCDMKLTTNNFHVVMTETFNKAINVMEKKDKFFSEFLCLCIQSPIEVVTKAINEALTNSKQIPLMVELLECLAPVCSVFDADNITSSRNEKISTVTCLLNDAVGNGFTDVEKSNFLILITALTNHNVVESTVFVEKCLIPALYESLNQRRWSQLLLWLELLHLFINGTIKHVINIPHCLLLMILAQVLETSRWTLLTFCSGAVSVCEETLAIVRRMVNDFLDTKEIEDKEVKWLQTKLDGFLSSLNKSYFSQLWCKFDREWSPGTYSVDTFLLDVMQNDCFNDEMNGKAIELFKDIDSKEDLLLFSLSKLLPLCTASEWQNLVRRMAEMTLFTKQMGGPVSQMHLFANSVLLFLFAIKNKGIQDDECTLSCLDYTIRNLGFILKEEIIPQLKCLPTRVQVKMLIKLLYILGQLPTNIKDSCSIVIINVLVELLPEILNETTRENEEAASDDVSSYVTEISTIIGILGNGEPLQILARKLMECMTMETQ
ncbi:uncharacterized protein [Periplaneta americana]